MKKNIAVFLFFLMIVPCSFFAQSLAERKKADEAFLKHLPMHLSLWVKEKVITRHQRNEILKLYVPRHKHKKPFLKVRALSQKWDWWFKYDYKKEKREYEELIVPVNKVIQLQLRSSDIVHSLAIPTHHIKQYILPGIVGSLDIKFSKKGIFKMVCTYCKELPHMAKIKVVTEEEFNKLFFAKPKETKKMPGEDVFRNYCITCHDPTGRVSLGPSLNNIMGKKRRVLTDGKEREIIVDEQYIKNSILKPGMDIVEGYPNVQPVFPLTDEEMDFIIEYLKTLK